MTWKDLIMFRCHNGVVKEGMLAIGHTVPAGDEVGDDEVQGREGSEEGLQEGRGVGCSGLSGPRQGFRL